MSKKVFDYPRTPTTAMIWILFPCGRTYDVPAQIVADDRDANYASDQEDTIGFIRNGQLDDYDLIDWASNNMNWEDLEPHAVEVPVSPPEPDLEEEWGNAEKRVMGDI